MRSAALHASINTTILVTIVIFNTLRYSEVGGPDSPFNAVSFLLAVGFIALNFRFHRGLTLAFAIPLIFLTLSFVANLDSLTLGGVNATLSTVAGYALLALMPMPLNQRLLRNAVFAYLAVCLLLSAYVSASHIASMSVTGNPNFNVNPNSAARFFLSCLVLALVFCGWRARLVFAVAFSLLMLTTGSRAGFVSAGLLLTGSILMGTELGNRRIVRSLLSKRRLKAQVAWAAALLSVPVLALYLIPGAVERLSRRLSAYGLRPTFAAGARQDIWQTAISVSQQSPATMLLGTGPATAVANVGRGVHSSYMNAITSLGWPFMLSVTGALIYLCRYHLRHGQRDFVLYALVICIHGAAETSLFIALGSTWFILILISLYFRSVAPKPMSA